MTDDLSAEGGEVLDPNIRAELKALRDEKAKNEAEIHSLRRESAFTEAGIPREGAGALLRKAYEGDLDPAAIKKSAEDYGLSFSPADPPPPSIPPEELAAQQRIAGANIGSSSEPVATASIKDQLNALNSEAEVNAFMARMKEGRP